MKVRLPPMAYSDSTDDLNTVKKMRILEKELSVVHTRIRMYEGIYQQASNRIDGMQRHYREFHGNPQPNLIEEDPDYRKAIERMNSAMHHLRALELEKEELMKKVQNLMYRS